MNTHPFLEAETIHGVMFVRPVSRVDGIHHEHIQKAVNEYISITSVPRIVIDLHYVRFMTIDTQKKLLAWIKVSRSLNGDVKLCNVSRLIQQILRSAQFPSLHIYESETLAARSFFKRQIKQTHAELA
jgi:anti-anti-sigma factor